MSSDNRKRKVIASYTLRCEGVSTSLIAPLLEHGRAGVSVTVYEDGFREVGCAYLDKRSHACMAEGKGATQRCVHLHPVVARSDIGFSWGNLRTNANN